MKENIDGCAPTTPINRLKNGVVPTLGGLSYQGFVNLPPFFSDGSFFMNLAFPKQTVGPKTRQAYL